MSINVMSRVWTDSTASESSLLVMLALADRADEDGVCWPSLETLGKKARIKDERHIRRILRRQEDVGELYVSSGQGRGRTSLYLICIGQTADEIARILVRRYEMSISEAMSAAQSIVAKRTARADGDDQIQTNTPDEKGGLEAQKGGHKPPIVSDEKGVYTREKGVYTREKGGHTPPDTSVIHQDPSVEDDTAREASPPEQQTVSSSSRPAGTERIRLPAAAVAALIQPQDPAYQAAMVAWSKHMSGTLTPLLSQEIKVALQTYPPEWIPLAMETAGAKKKRFWGYVQGILRTWQQEGINMADDRTGNAGHASRSKGYGRYMQQASATSVKGPDIDYDNDPEWQEFVAGFVDARDAAQQRLAAAASD